MSSPKVSVICLCYNHQEFVEESIQSVLDQEYDLVELIVVDDGSSDGSKDAIDSIQKKIGFKFISLDKSLGNCKAFNIGFKESSGEFIIDLAADDVLMPNRISEGIKAFSSDKVGVDFCDAYTIDKKGNTLSTHFKRAQSGELQEDIAEGDIYQELIAKYFVSAPTMMIRRSVLEELNGYDEKLSYEDFDFWIRSSRNWHYHFSDQILVKKRSLKNSHGNQQFRFLSRHQRSTLEVCRKIKILNKFQSENLALRKRCKYEIRQCIKQGNLRLIPGFLKLMK